MYTDDEVFHRYYSNFDSDMHKASHYAGQAGVRGSQVSHNMHVQYVNVCTYVGTYVCVHTSIFLSALSHSFCPGPDVEQTLSSSLIESVTALQHSATAPNSRQHFRLDFDSNALGHA